MVVFTVDVGSDERLQNQQGIRDEAASWLQSLDVTARGVSVRRPTKAGGRAA